MQDAERLYIETKERYIKNFLPNIFIYILFSYILVILLQLQIKSNKVTYLKTNQPLNKVETRNHETEQII